MPSPLATSTPGIAHSTGPGMGSLERRTPEPMSASVPSSANRESTKTRQPSATPSGPIPPYSWQDSAVARSIDMNDALRASSSLRTRVLTSANVDAGTHARRDPLRVAAAAVDEHAVGRRVERQVV